MGRYYNGDINGKFWFAVQPSNSADRFGVQGFQPEYIEYQFREDDKPGVEAELKKIEKVLGDQLQLMEDFFSQHLCYTDDKLTENGIDLSKLRDYADYKLGKKILDCLNENGYCEFTAEL
jgi:hypothetical protein